MGKGLSKRCEESEKGHEEWPGGGLSVGLFGRRLGRLLKIPKREFAFYKA